MTGSGRLPRNPLGRASLNPLSWRTQGSEDPGNNDDMGAQAPQAGKGVGDNFLCGYSAIHVATSSVLDGTQPGRGANHSIPPGFLGFVEPRVHPGENVLERLTVLRPAPDSGADRQRLGAFGSWNGDPGEFGAKLIHAPARSADFHAGEGHNEFLAAEAGNEVSCPHQLAKSLGQELERAIAGQVTKSIVEPLELIDV